MMGLRAYTVDTILCTLQVVPWILHAQSVDPIANTPDSDLPHGDEIFLCYQTVRAQPI